MIVSKGELIVLVDFDNFFKKPVENYSITELEFDFKVIIDSIIKHLSGKRYFLLRIRLYSGWLENATYTKSASEILQKVAMLNLFPINISNNILMDGRIEIATSLNDIPEHVFEHTYKEKKGVPRIRIKKEVMEEICNINRDHCPGHLLSNFTKKKNKLCSVKGCNTNHSDLFFLREQKMVDTIIACDLISFCENESIDAVFLISDDTDHIPALITGSRKNNNNKKIYLTIRNSWNIDIFKSILNNFSISINHLSS